VVAEIGGEIVSMIKNIKFNGDESNFYFLGCAHYRHNRTWIVDARGFKTIEEHDSNFIIQWNSYCTLNSICFSLGDLIFNDGKGEEFWKLIRRLNFKQLWAMPGNHYSGFRQAYLKTLKDQFPNAINELGELLYEVYPLKTIVDGYKELIFIPNYVELIINSTQIVACHYPIVSHNHQGAGSYMFCSHSHSNCKLTNKDTGQGLRIDLGFDSFGRPMSLKEIKRHLNGRSLDSWDHHSKNE
jgi:calcineurin-like phosphoesterase family protein